MTDSIARAEAHLATLRADGYNMPDCVQFGDETGGDFGVAHTGVSGGCTYITFDREYDAQDHTVWHELGHAFQFNNDGLLEAFWAECGFQTSIDSANEQANNYAAQGMAWASWQSWAIETFAEFFAWSILNDGMHAMDWGVQRTPELRARLNNLFVNWESDVARLDPADLESIATIINARVGAAEVNIMREVLAKLDAGFNVTLPAIADRIVAGDKKTETAEVDK